MGGAVGGGGEACDEFARGDVIREDVAAGDEVSIDGGASGTNVAELSDCVDGVADDGLSPDVTIVDLNCGEVVSGNVIIGALKQWCCGYRYVCCLRGRNCGEESRGGYE